MLTFLFTSSSYLDHLPLRSSSIEFLFYLSKYPKLWVYNTLTFKNIRVLKSPSLVSGKWKKIEYFWVSPSSVLLWVKLPILKYCSHAPIKIDSNWINVKPVANTIFTQSTRTNEENLGFWRKVKVWIKTSKSKKNIIHKK